MGKRKCLKLEWPETKMDIPPKLCFILPMPQFKGIITLKFSWLFVFPPKMVLIVLKYHFFLKNAPGYREDKMLLVVSSAISVALFSFDKGNVINNKDRGFILDNISNIITSLPIYLSVCTRILFRKLTPVPRIILGYHFCVPNSCKG